MSGKRLNCTRGTWGEVREDSGTWGITGGTFVTHGSTHDSSPLVRPRLHGLQLGMKIKYIPKMNKYLVEEK